MNVAEKVHDFFDEHAGDGTFDLWYDCFPTTYVPYLPSMHGLLYVQKPSVLRRLVDGCAPPELTFGLLSQVGLPTQRVVTMLESLTSLRFVSALVDLDPVGLMTFAWLREKLPEKKVTLIGINTQMCEHIGVIPTYPLLIEFEPSEQKAFEMLSCNYPALLEEPGEICNQLFKQHKKLELESFLSRENEHSKTVEWIKNRMNEIAASV